MKGFLSIEALVAVLAIVLFLSWMVVSSERFFERAEKSASKIIAKEKAVEKALLVNSFYSNSPDEMGLSAGDCDFKGKEIRCSFNGEYAESEHLAVEAKTIVENGKAVLRVKGSEHYG